MFSRPDQSFLVSRRSRSGDLLVTFDFSYLKHSLKIIFFSWLVLPLIRVVKAVVRSLEFVESQIKFIPMIMAIGLGLGVSLTVVLNPDTSTATPSLAAPLSSGIEIDRVVVSDLGVDAMSVELKSSLLTKNKTTTIYGDNKAGNFAALSEAQLGQRVQILGKNNGWYSYTIIETRFVRAEDLPGSLAQIDPAVILYTPADTLKKNFYLVKAK